MVKSCLMLPAHEGALVRDLAVGDRVNGLDHLVSVFDPDGAQVARHVDDWRVLLMDDGFLRDSYFGNAAAVFDDLNSGLLS